MAADTGNNFRGGQIGDEYGLRRDADIRDNQAGADNVRAAPRILFTVLADGLGRLGDCERRAGTGRAEHIFRGAGESEHGAFQSGRDAVFFGRIYLHDIRLARSGAGDVPLREAGEEKGGGRFVTVGGAGVSFDGHYRAD